MEIIKVLPEEMNKFSLKYAHYLSAYIGKVFINIYS